MVKVPLQHPQRYTEKGTLSTKIVPRAATPESPRHNRTHMIHPIIPSLTLEQVQQQQSSDYNQQPLNNDSFENEMDAMSEGNIQGGAGESTDRFFESNRRFSNDDQ